MTEKSPSNGNPASNPVLFEFNDVIMTCSKSETIDDEEKTVKIRESVASIKISEDEVTYGEYSGKPILDVPMNDYFRDDNIVFRDPFEEFWARHFNPDVVQIKGEMISEERFAYVNESYPFGDEVYYEEDGDEVYSEEDGDEVYSEEDGVEKYYEKDGYEGYCEEDGGYCEEDGRYCEKDGDEICSEEDGESEFSEEDEVQPEGNHDEEDVNLRMEEPLQSPEIEPEVVHNEEHYMNRILSIYNQRTGDQNQSGEIEDIDEYFAMEWDFRSRIRNYYCTPPKRDYDNEYFDQTPFELYFAKGSILKWVVQYDVAELIRHQFKEFLLTSFDLKSGDYEYKLKIDDMISGEKCTLEVDFRKFVLFEPAIGSWLERATRPVLKVMDKVASDIVYVISNRYWRDHRNIYVRITNLGLFKRIHDLSSKDFNTMVLTAGVVTRLSKLRDGWMVIIYKCKMCKTSFLNMDAHAANTVFACKNCLAEAPHEIINKKSTRGKYRLLTLQDNLGTASPTKIDVVLFDDLVDCARRGKYIEVNGIYSKCGELLPEYNTIPHGKKGLIEAHYIKKACVDKLSKDPSAENKNLLVQSC